MSRMADTLPPEVCERAVRMVQDHEHEHPSRWAVTSVTGETAEKWTLRSTLADEAGETRLGAYDKAGKWGLTLA